MLDTELYTLLLGLSTPWKVVEVVIDETAQRVDVHAEHEPAVHFPCPACGVLLPVYDHTPLRGWRHLDSCDYFTFLQAALPRVACRQHGIRQILPPWASPGSRFTCPFERRAIDTLRHTDVHGAAQLLRLSWEQTWGIMARAVGRGQQRKRRRVIRLLGVDEKAVGRGQDYFTLVTDWTRRTVEYVGDGRTVESLDAYYDSLTARQLAGIEAVAMDMWQPFVRSTLDHVPNALRKIVFDRYHIMKHMNEAVDSVRKGEQRRLGAQGDDTLKGTKYLWLFAEKNLPKRHRSRFALLKRLHLKLDFRTFS